MSVNRIDMEDITTRYAELRDERADLQSEIDDTAETLADLRDKRTEACSAEFDDEITDADEALTAARRALAEWDADNVEELAELAELLEELRGAGGDHKWEGDWYPRELIAEHDFEEYAQELAEDCGMVDTNAGWPNNCIDWEKAARELAPDYSMVSFRGSDYYYR